MASKFSDVINLSSFKTWFSLLKRDNNILNVCYNFLLFSHWSAHHVNKQNTAHFVNKKPCSLDKKQIQHWESNESLKTEVPLDGLFIERHQQKGSFFNECKAYKILNIDLVWIFEIKFAVRFSVEYRLITPNLTTGLDGPENCRLDKYFAAINLSRRRRHIKFISTFFTTWLGTLNPADFCYLSGKQITKIESICGSTFETSKLSCLRSDALQQMSRELERRP